MVELSLLIKFVSAIASFGSCVLAFILLAKKQEKTNISTEDPSDRASDPLITAQQSLLREFKLLRIESEAAMARCIAAIQESDRQKADAIRELRLARLALSANKPTSVPSGCLPAASDD
jgi:hypothetical protein